MSLFFNGVAAAIGDAADYIAGKSGAPPGVRAPWELLSFVKDPAGSMTDHRDMYGDIFITGSRLVKEIVGFCGPEALAQFNAGLENGSIVREGSFPQPIVGEYAACLK